MKKSKSNAASQKLVIEKRAENEARMTRVINAGLIERVTALEDDIFYLSLAVVFISVSSILLLREK